MYLVTRHGMNRANQHLVERMDVAIVEATSAEEAAKVASLLVTVYANQLLTARHVNSCPARAAAFTAKAGL